MTDIEKRLKEIEERVRDLEARPCYVPQPIAVPYPVYPNPYAPAPWQWPWYVTCQVQSTAGTITNSGE
jgi:hypothetical protein